MNDYHQTAALALAKCAAYDPWFPKASLATVEAWAEAISEYRLDTDDVLEGVKVAYRENGSGFKPLPRDIVQAARNIRRDRAERESIEERHRRESAIDAKADGRIRHIADFAASRYAIEDGGHSHA
jgi:hypothetical protein